MHKFSSSLKAALLCFIFSGLVTAFKLLHKDYADTVDRPSIEPSTMQSDDNGVTTSPPIIVITAKMRTISGGSL